MREIYCIECKKYKEFKKPKILYICYKTLLLSSICNKYIEKNNQKYIEKKNQLNVIMSEENRSQEFRLKYVDKIRGYLIEEIDRNGLVSKKYKIGLYNSKLYWTLSYFNFYNSWMYFQFWFCFFSPIGIRSSAIGLKICVINAGIKKYKSKSKKKKKHDKIVLLKKSKLNRT